MDKSGDVSECAIPGVSCRVLKAESPCMVKSLREIERLKALRPELEFARETHDEWANASDAALARNPEIGSRDFHRSCVALYDERLAAIDDACDLVERMAARLEEMSGVKI